MCDSVYPWGKISAYDAKIIEPSFSKRKRSVRISGSAQKLSISVPDSYNYCNQPACEVLCETGKRATPSVEQNGRFQKSGFKCTICIILNHDKIRIWCGRSEERDVNVETFAMLFDTEKHVKNK